MSNQYTYRVPFTADQLAEDYTSGMTQSEIARKHGTTQKVVWNAMRKLGIKSRVAAKRHQAGPANSNWKGGRHLCAKVKSQRGERSSFGNGYYYVKDETHPNANKSGYVAEHIVVALESSNRESLEKGEVVHHVDLDKHNNKPDNLAIASRKIHAEWHNQLEEIAVQFMREGLIGFDAERGYFRVE